MTFACLAVVGTLCISPTAGHSEIKIRHDAGLSEFVDLSTDDWEIDQTLSSDCIGCGPSKSLFSETCAEGECVSYFRQCDDADHPTACSYYFDRYPPVEVRAKSEITFRETVANIGLIQRSDPLRSVFPLAVFTTEGAGRRGFAPENPLRSRTKDKK